MSIGCNQHVAIVWVRGIKRDEIVVLLGLGGSAPHAPCLLTRIALVSVVLPKPQRVFPFDVLRGGGGLSKPLDRQCAGRPAIADREGCINFELVLYWIYYIEVQSSGNGQD